MSPVPNQARQRLAPFAVVEQTTEHVLEDHTSADYVRHAGANLALPSPRSYPEDADGLLDPEEAVQGVLEGSVSFPATPIRPSGSVGGDSECDPILNALLGESATPASTTVNDVAATVDGATLTSVTGLEEGDLVFFADPGECTIIESISGNDVTFAVPLSAAPGDTTAVHFGKQFRPADDLPLTSVHMDLEHTHEAASDMIWNEGSVAYTGGANPRATLQASAIGGGKRSWAGTSSVENNDVIGGGNGITAVDTTLKVPDGEGRRYVTQAGALYLQMENEIVRVDDVEITAEGSPDELTIVRAQKSTSAAEHLQGTEVSPWFATPTHTGTQISAIEGDVVLKSGPLRVVLPLREASLQINNGYAMDNDGLRSFRNNRFRQGGRPREVTWQITARFTKDVIQQLGHGHGQVTGPVVIWAHTLVGGAASTPIVVCGSRKVSWMVPDKSAGVGDQFTLTITGRALAPEAGLADPVRVAII